MTLSVLGDIPNCSTQPNYVGQWQTTDMSLGTAVFYLLNALQA